MPRDTCQPDHVSPGGHVRPGSRDGHAAPGAWCAGKLSLSCHTSCHSSLAGPAGGGCQCDAEAGVGEHQRRYGDDSGEGGGDDQRGQGNTQGHRGQREEESRRKSL